MRLKSFTGPTMSDVMEQVRAVLGDDAVILATQEDEEKGVRVTAAVEHAAGALADLAATAVTSREPDPAAPAAESDPIEALLEQHGVPPATVRRLFGRQRRSATPPDLLTRLERWFSYAPLAGTTKRQKLILVGPPGSGKTQTVAKLAARALVAGQKAGLITTDTERSAGIGALAGFARALRLELLVSDSPSVLAAGMLSLAACDVVVIDTAGCNHLVAEDMAALETLVAQSGAEPVLVLPAGMDPLDAAEMAAAFHRIGAKRMIVTRLDLTRRLGSVIAAAREGLALAEFSRTARIKDGLEPADTERFAALLSPPPSPPTATRTGSVR